MSALKQAWRWQPRAQALEPRAALAWGEASRRLHARLLALPAEQLAGLQATAADDLLVVIGEADALPWVEGIDYAAPCEGAPELWLPTRLRPDAPLDLLARALAKRHGRTPLLLWPAPARTVPLDRQLPLSEGHLARIAEHWAAP
ncbi:hypothetical protein [Metapseudomonas otitidis]|uniref:bpX5 domain-containing protein n=1 Tax=Metapseudomonas otitidis TaxID=319939 RepID=UPI0013F61434|nr:hypothetical protein [Pseudomonas otitidis]